MAYDRRIESEPIYDMNIRRLSAHKRHASSPASVIVYTATSPSARPPPSHCSCYRQHLFRDIALSACSLENEQTYYLPDESQHSEWFASPLLSPDELLKGAPKKCWVGVAELDILRDEGLAFASKLEKAGVSARVVVYEGAPHPIMAMDDVLAIGKKMVKDAGEALKAALYE